MNKKYCCLCKREVKDNDAILTMGLYGTPRHLCEACEERLDVLTLGREVAEIDKASREITDTMRLAEVDDELIIDTVAGILDEAKNRRDAIENGSYDFSLDEEAEGGADGEENADAPAEITEELTEEDTRELTEEEIKKAEREEKIVRVLDKISPWIFASALLAAVVYLIIKLL